MPSFTGSDKIQIQSFDKINYDFDIRSCSTSASNDGFLPYNRTVSSVAVSGYNEDKTTTVNDLISGLPVVTVYPNQKRSIITVTLKYPAIHGNGLYNLRFLMTLDNGQKKEADFNRIDVVNL